MTSVAPKLYKRRHTLVLMWLGGLAAYHLAWTAHPTAAFTLNAFDLAEQIRIHPAIVAETPSLRSALVLWSAIPLIAIGLATVASLYQRWAVRWGLQVLAGLVALRVIPPEGALRAPTTLLIEDPYHRGLLLLTMLGLLGVGLAWLLAGLIRHYMLPIQLGIAILAGLLPLWGFERGFRLLGELGLSVSLGGGLLVYGGLLMGVVLLGGWAWGTHQESEAHVQHS